MSIVTRQLSNVKSQIKTFEDLEVWRSCRELRKKIFALTKGIPVEEKYGLIRQLRNAAVSATANIAEGYGRFHYQENIQFCRQSRGSLYENLDHLTTCLDNGYISESHFGNLRSEALRSIQLLNGYIRMLHKAKLEE